MKIKRVPGVAIAVLAFSLVAQGSAFAADGSQPKTLFGPNKIVGLWEVDVVIENCLTGDPAGAFKAMHQYQMGGTGQVVPATNPALLSGHLAVWEHVRRNDYRQVVKFYRFDPTGSPVGSTVIRNEITINQSGTEYFGSGVADFYDLGGNYLFSSCPSFIGTRVGAQP